MESPKEFSSTVEKRRLIRPQAIADDGDGFAEIEVEFEDRRLALRRPSALAGRSLRKAIFIHENNGAPPARRPRRDSWPCLLFPLADFVLLALARTAVGLLRAPLHRAQQPSDVGRAGDDTQMLGHDRAHPRQTSERVVVTFSLRPLSQQLRQTRAVRVVEHRRRSAPTTHGFLKNT